MRLRKKQILKTMFASTLFLSLTYAGILFHRTLGIPSQKKHLTSEFATEKFFYQIVGKDAPVVLEEKRMNKEQSYTLHLGTYKEKDQAWAALQRATDAGLQAFIIPIQQGSFILFHVRSGFYKKKEDAMALVAELKNKKIKPDIIALY